MDALTKIQNKIDEIISQSEVNEKRLAFYLDKERELKVYLSWCSKHKGFIHNGIVIPFEPIAM